MSPPQSTRPTLYIINRNYSTWSLRGWLPLRLLNIEHDIVKLTVGTKEVPAFGPNSVEMMRKAGPSSKVPALHVIKPNGDKHIVFETSAIHEYLAEDHPSLWPLDRYDRTYARSLYSEFATGLNGVKTFSMNIRQKYAFDPNLYGEQEAKDFTRVCSIWEELRSATVEKALKGQVKDEGFLFGHFTNLDAMYAPVMFRIKTFDLWDKVQGKHAQAYIHHVLQMEPMKEWEALAVQETEIMAKDEVYPVTSA